jgi:hypothetical protein
MQLNVSLTQNDLSKGLRRNSTECPVARSIKRAVPPDYNVTVTRETIHITNEDGHTKTLHTPLAVASVVNAVDSGWIKHVKPFNFTLTVPD